MYDRGRGARCDGVPGWGGEGGSGGGRAIAPQARENGGKSRRRFREEERNWKVAARPGDPDSLALALANRFPGGRRGVARSTYSLHYPAIDPLAPFWTQPSHGFSRGVAASVATATATADNL
jgi:hypothetical protein